ncbi:MAG TPA: hypothetical protein VF980_06140 [Thermoanaerobaculia bacterium]
MAEQVLNFAWLSIAVFAFAVVLPSLQRRRTQVLVALIGTLALLFPIISISDDFNADTNAQEVLAILLTVASLVVTLGAVARLIPAPLPRIAPATVDLSDPRSPPLG